ncbi:MAG TPA: DUF1998 domain-containing protein [Blastocatellia bacterium]|nr:DUF1998 domain-containing protein [Blastocatellia bacterium]
MTKPKLRSSQMITTFGPGAMVDLPEASVIIAGLDHWHYDPLKLSAVEEPRLVAKLRKALEVNTLTLRTPPAASEQDYGVQPKVVAWRFPEWFIVQKSVRTRAGFTRRRLVHLNDLDKGKWRDEDGKRQTVVPIRFVRACKKGHVGDVDWKAFVHGTEPCGRDLWIEEQGTSGDLGEILVVCDCGTERPLSLAAQFASKALGHCDGSRPWLGPLTKESCDQLNRLLIRSASNAYFPQLMSAISIPDPHRRVDDAVRSLWDDFLSEVTEVDEVSRIRKKPTPAAKLEGFSDEDVLAAIERQRSGDNSLEGPVKDVEFRALSEAAEELGSDEPDGVFYARSLPRSKWESPWMDHVSRVVLAHRLREVVAQVGFTRFEAHSPDIQGELELDVQQAPLALDVSWLPAVENRGEGVFLLFKPEAIRKWTEREQVKRRGRRLSEGFEQWKADHRATSARFFGLPYYMLHSLSHLLLTSISLECGYPASSLRERVYAWNDQYGILIYTGTSDAKGTLGGLFQTGRDIKRHLHRALETASLCSNDPICAYHAPGEHDQRTLLGSACHGCILIAETSCEQHNDYLDRSLVVPTVEGLAAEFFESVI